MKTRAAFTLIELLVVVAIIALLMSILLPTLSVAKQQGRAAKCLAQLRVLGQGIAIYGHDHRDVLPPGRLPKWPGQDCGPYANIFGGRKYRPTFVAMMSPAVNAAPFLDPKSCRTDTDMFGEAGDRQNYSYGVYICPSAADWTDEKNASIGYNYQFLGNSRLLDTNDPFSYKHWPVPSTRIRQPGQTVAAADCMGTAASFSPAARQVYVNNSNDVDRFGCEGFNLDPPRVDPINGEMASAPSERSAVDPRHRGRGNVLWVDAHGSASTLAKLGDKLEADGRVGIDGDNAQWSGNGRDVAWTPQFEP